MDRIVRAKVVEHFEKTEEYHQRKGFIHPEFDPLILQFIRERVSDPKGVRVLEVGGGSGYMLDLIFRETGIECLYNCEIVPKVYKNQVNDRICLIGGDALNLPFKSNSFDYVIIKNLLHHLVGKTRGESKKFAEMAVRELARVAKDGGYIIVLEQYNQSRFFSTIVFYLTLLFSILGVSFRRLGWGKNVIVSFLTPTEIDEILNRYVNVVLTRETSLKVPKIWKYTVLMSRVGRKLVVGCCVKTDKN